MPHKSAKKNKSHERNVKKRRRQSELRRLGRIAEGMGLSLSTPLEVTHVTSTETYHVADDSVVKEKKVMKMRRVKQ